MKWYYFYTPDYEPWHNHLESTLKEHFIVHPIKIQPDELNIHDNHPSHHFTGSTKKIDLVIECIKNNIGTRIVFSDVTWYINTHKVEELKKLICEAGYGITFARNKDFGLNIGLLAIDCNNETLKIWEEAKKTIENNNSLHDQTVVHNMINNPQIFDNKKIVARWPEHLDKDAFLALKLFTPATESKFVRDTFRYKIMELYGYPLIDKIDVVNDTVNHYLKHTYIN
jgi:hypothetical protein